MKTQYRIVGIGRGILDIGAENLHEVFQPRHTIEYNQEKVRLELKNQDGVVNSIALEKYLHGGLRPFGLLDIRQAEANKDSTVPLAGDLVVNSYLANGYLLISGIYEGGDLMDKESYDVIDYYDPTEN